MSKGKRNQPPEGTPQPGATRTSPADVQEREFRLAFRGYNERDVDVFLDEITEELSRLLGENRRLREQLEGKGPVTADPDHALLEADAIVLRAHEEAARILADAQRQAVAAEGVDGDQAIPLDAEGLAHPAVPIVSTFIARERGFLQNMAALIQRHAEEVKQDIRRAKDAGLTAGIDRPADATSSTVVAPVASGLEVVEGEAEDVGPAAAEDASAVDAEWVPDAAVPDVEDAEAADRPLGDGTPDDGGESEEPSWEAVAEAAWSAPAASWSSSKGPDRGAEVEPENGGVGMQASVATELERPDLGTVPAGLVAGERAVGIDDAPPLVHAAVRVGDDQAGGGAREEEDPPTLQELFWGES
jgi:DivIVA domain-containing protein